MTGLVVSLFDLTGEWARPWHEAGHPVLLVDSAHEAPDVDGMPTLVCDLSEPAGISAVVRAVGDRDVDVLLAAPPCTCFSRVSARWWPGMDADGRTARDLRCVASTVTLVSLFQPRVWALENPPGRSWKPDGSGLWQTRHVLDRAPALEFDPWRFGALAPEDSRSRLTKRTRLWGKFRAPQPAPLERETYPEHLKPGSRDFTSRVSSSWKRERARTPRGFARAFYLANRPMGREDVAA